ncbi:MAG TPA: hypothetical protein VGH40_00970 [Roseiarcus sp.]|jgi:hypothetical protein
MARLAFSLLLALAVIAGLPGAGLAQTLAPSEAPATDSGPATLRLSAVLTGSDAPLTGGLRWRVFGLRPEGDGSRPLIVESSEAQPTLTIPAGDYVVHVALGLASATKRVTLGSEVRSERLAVNAGALRINGTLGGATIDASKLSLAIYVPERNNPEAKLVYPKARAGEIIGLPEGSYHIVSTYLDTVSVGAFGGKPAAPTPTNSIVSADIKVSAGKLVDVTLRHRCATVTIKLVNAPGAEALANSSFTVLTPGGDLIRDLIGAFPSLVLGEGEYVVIARHDSKTYQATFQVQSGLDREVEVIAKESPKQD